MWCYQSYYNSPCPSDPPQDPHSTDDPLSTIVNPSPKENTLKFSLSPKKVNQLSKYTVSPVSKSR